MRAGGTHSMHSCEGGGGRVKNDVSSGTTSKTFSLLIAGVTDNSKTEWSGE